MIRGSAVLASKGNGEVIAMAMDLNPGSIVLAQNESYTAHKATREGSYWLLKTLDSCLTNRIIDFDMIKINININHYFYLSLFISLFISLFALFFLLVVFLGVRTMHPTFYLIFWLTVILILTFEFNLFI